MIDFFDEIFPLTKRQEELAKLASEEAEKDENDAAKAVGSEEYHDEISDVSHTECKEQDDVEKECEVNGELSRDADTEVGSSSDDQPEHCPEIEFDEGGGNAAGISNNNEADALDNEATDEACVPEKPVEYDDQKASEAVIEDEDHESVGDDGASADNDMTDKNIETESQSSEEFISDASSDSELEDNVDGSHNTCGGTHCSGNDDFDRMSECVMEAVKEVLDSEICGGLNCIDVPNSQDLSETATSLTGTSRAATEEALREELALLVEKLDEASDFGEAACGASDDESDNQDFSYEYDDRFFAEEETPAYKYPKMYAKTETVKAPSRTPSKKVGKSGGILTLNTKTLLKVGAVVAATAAAVKLLGKHED